MRSYLPRRTLGSPSTTCQLTARARQRNGVDSQGIPPNVHSGDAMTNAWVRPDRPLVVAHRGIPVRFPENTMPSFRAAIAGGAEMIEADVQLSRDGVLVMMHDTTVDRTTNGKGPLADLTYEELGALDAGGWFGPAFVGTGI